MMSAGRTAVIGEGVIGLSTALAILEKWPHTKITVFHDRPFLQSCSYGPAGLFRIDKESCKEYGRLTFDRLVKISKEISGDKSGVKLLSGHIQSDSKAMLEQQEKNYGDIVYNFRWLNEREIDGLFDKPAKYCIHYTAFACEGNKYVPFLKDQCIRRGAVFKQRKIEGVDELSSSFDVIVNCAGLNGGKVAGDDDSVVPIKGIAVEVEAPWHKHFHYHDVTTFTIPKVNSVVLGTIKRVGDDSLEITDTDRKDIWDRYLKLHPQLQGTRVLSEWCNLRPERETVRVEAQTRQIKGKQFLVVHNYGHGGNGFTIGWGTALRAVQLIEQNLVPTSRL